MSPFCGLIQTEFTMDHPVVQLPVDLTGSNPNNQVSGEEHLLVDLDGFPYKIITLFHGGFYTRGLKVYDESGNRLQPYVDFICTYKHPLLSERTGLEVCSAIVVLNTTITGIVTVAGQMVGGDLAYSFTVINDYIAFWKTKTDYIPIWADYNGQEPIWGPGELATARWGLDTYQPMNNELENISRRLMLGAAESEDNLRKRIRNRYNDFMARFNDKLDQHIVDINNPHRTTATLIKLGNVRNLEVATPEIALALQSNDHYLTPQLVWKISDAATKPLYDHIALNPADPHSTTPAQLNAPSAETARAGVAAKQDKNTTISSTRSIFYQGAWRRYEEFTAMMRKNLTTAMFTEGRLQEKKIASGATDPDRVLRGDLRWTLVTDILSEKVPGGTASVFYGSYPHNDLNIVKQTISTLPAYAYAPVSSIYVAQTVTTVGQGYGNGETFYAVNQRSVFVMSAGGWVLV